MKHLKNIFVCVLFLLLIFGIYKAIENKEFGLSIVVLSVLFMFAYIMMRMKQIKDFHIGGDKLSVSVNEGNDEPKS